MGRLFNSGMKRAASSSRSLPTARAVWVGNMAANTDFAAFVEDLVGRGTPGLGKQLIPRLLTVLCDV